MYPLVMLNFTWIDATSRPCGAKMLIFGLWVNLIPAGCRKSSLPLRGILPIKIRHIINICISQCFSTESYTWNVKHWTVTRFILLKWCRGNVCKMSDLLLQIVNFSVDIAYKTLGLFYIAASFCREYLEIHGGGFWQGLYKQRCKCSLR